MANITEHRSSLTAPCVLVVDDDPDGRRLTVLVMRQSGFSTLEAGSADDALRLVATEHVDAILLDVAMPGMDGVECLSLLRRSPSTAHTPVLMVTALGQVDDVVVALDAGADDYVVKPFAPDDLGARVHRQVRRKTEWASLVRDEVRRRNALLAAASSASRTTTASQGAIQVSEELLAVDGVRGAAIVEIVGHDFIVLATKGCDPLAALLDGRGQRDFGQHLVRRVASGAWLEPTPGIGTGVISIAPIRVDDAVVGLVMVTPEAWASRTDIDRIHGTTIDFGILSSGLFGVALADSARRDDERQRAADPIERGEFTTVFQPIIDLTSSTVVGHEALTRFGTGADTAETFAHAARLGLTSLVEVKTLEAAIDRSSELDGPGWVAVNVSPSVLLQQDLRPLFDRSADRGIVLELSELEPVIDYDAVHRAVAALGGNVVLSVDDAGAGFASLSHVLALRARYVKIDRSWVQGIEADPAKRALVAGIRNFAAETDATVIAEGIETEDELDTLVQLGIDLGQGFLLGRPALP